MLVLITYDVNTEDAAGRKRLRQIAKQCVNYGQRVQCSVFECLLDAAQCKMLQAKLCAIMGRKRIVYGFIIWVIDMIERSNILAANPLTSLRTITVVKGANVKRSENP